MKCEWNILRHARAIMLALCLFLTVAAYGGERSDLDGVWLLTGSETPENLHLTAAGRAAFESYEPLRDDSDLQCDPGSFTNAMHTPSPPFEINQHDDHVEINYEYMDIRRRVPLDHELTIEAAPYTAQKYPQLGRSIGHYEGETLVVESADQEAGVLDTLGVPGLPQSAEMRTEERFIPDGDNLRVTVIHNDPINYSEELVVTFSFHRLDDGEILEWGCVPEAAGYEEYLDELR